LRTYEICPGGSIPLTGHSTDLWEPGEYWRDRRHRIEVGDPRKISRDDPTLHDGQVIAHALDCEPPRTETIERILCGRVELYINMHPRSLLPRWGNLRWCEHLGFRLTGPRETAQD